MKKLIILAFISSWSILQASQKEMPDKSIQRTYQHHLDQFKINPNDYHKNSAKQLLQAYPALKELKSSGEKVAENLLSYTSQGTLDQRKNSFGILNPPTTSSK